MTERGRNCIFLNKQNVPNVILVEGSRAIDLLSSLSKLLKFLKIVLSDAFKLPVARKRQLEIKTLVSQFSR